MAIRAGDIAPNPVLEGHEGPTVLYERVDPALVILLFGDTEAPLPLRWNEIVHEAIASDGEIRTFRILPSEVYVQPGVLLDPTLEAHRRYDAYDWEEMRPITTVVALAHSGLIRFSTENMTLGLEPLFKIMHAHTLRIRHKKRA